jgi:asparagine synthase (glutamine-hydrolysing)
MTRLVRHRGPDGEGLIVVDAETNTVRPIISEDSPAGVHGTLELPSGGMLALGHRRLSILDLTASGHQPMGDAAGEVWITFNGEIYNFLELRAELAAVGHAFHTGTDTEVLLAAWREWGEAAFTRCNGMFALVLYDHRTRRLCAVRDRFGVKPLYFWRTPTGGFALASEIKQFTAHPGWVARLNGQRTYDFLHWGVLDHTRETLFAGVHQLAGGELLAAELAALPASSPRRWYDLQPAAFHGDLAEAAECFRGLFDDSVRLRLRADVPVGSCLSGGLDSSAIVCTIRAQLGDHAAATAQKTVSAFSEVARFDERQHVEAVLAATGVASVAVIPDPEELFTRLDEITWQQDEPFGSASIWAQWCVFRAARGAGLTVMLDGQGADEALGGYHGYFGPRLADLWMQGRFQALAAESGALRRIHGVGCWAQARMLANELLPARVGDWVRRFTAPESDGRHAIALARLGAVPGLPAACVRRGGDPFRSLCHGQLVASSLPKLLHWEDRNSMAHGIEARVPFLDYRLVEFCLGLPTDFKLCTGETKRVLREGLRGRLPDPVRRRTDKLGFATAEEEWMRGPHRAAFARLAEEAMAAGGNLFLPGARREIQQILAGERAFSFRLWRLISFGRWLRLFAVAPPP